MLIMCSFLASFEIILFHFLILINIFDTYVKIYIWTSVMIKTLKELFPLKAIQVLLKVINVWENLVCK